jgi:cytochrome c-type biogenesis protein CcmH
MKRSLAALGMTIMLAFPALAVEPSEMLKDPALEQRARTLSRELRCVVCQNQSIDDSQAEVAHDMRLAVRQRLSAGDTDRAVMGYMVARYGDYVLLEPPFKPRTLLLWLGAPLVLLVAGAALFLSARRKPTVQAPSPLDDVERARLKLILREPQDEVVREGPHPEEGPQGPSRRVG